VNCPTCHAISPEGAITCATCGATLSPAASAPTSPALVVGTKLQGGAFAVGKVLGQGGFGITYMASDTANRRAVAIKEFFPFGNCVRVGMTVQPTTVMPVTNYEHAQSRFLDEARVLARFNIPGIVRVYTSFTENNTAYMVMELLRGKTLAGVLKERGALPETEALEIVRRLGEALTVVHSANLLHRDIKPENVIQTQDGRSVLLDFGSARAFAAGQTRHMTAFVTVGYAPLEQYSQQARFGPYTDIYALAATLYQMLTGQVPIPSLDRTQGVQLQPPRTIIATISTRVSDAVMAAMAMKASERPQTVTAFLGMLGITPGAAPAPSPRPVVPPSATSAPPSSSANPYDARILQLERELDTPAPVVPRRHQARIYELTQQLNRVAQYIPPSPLQCPACRRAQLKEITTRSTAECPLCRSDQLADRPLDARQCPVCRTGKLWEQQLDRWEFFCAMCHVAPTIREYRSRFAGLIRDEWRTCPACKAEYDVIGSGNVRLVSIQADPLGVGAGLKGRDMPVAEWQKLSGRATVYYVSTDTACTAQFDVVDPHRWRLASLNPEVDPYGIGKQYAGKTLFREAWSKLAAGLPPSAGNRHCPLCKAEFDYHPADHAMKLLQAGTSANAARAETMRGQQFPPEQWWLTFSGKRSLYPGWLCPACHTEFDRDRDAARLVWTSAPQLAPAVRTARSLDDWQRLGSGIPTQADTAAFRKELDTLLGIQKREEQQVQHSDQQRRSQAQAELTNLLKQSFVEGYFPMTLHSTRLALKPGERLRWESNAQLLRQAAQRGSTSWSPEKQGTLIVTTWAVTLDTHLGKPWQQPLTKLLSVETQYDGPRQVVVLRFTTLRKPVGFTVEDRTLTVQLHGKPVPITVGARELADLLRRLSSRS